MQLRFALAAVEHQLNLLSEVLLLVGMDARDELLQRHLLDGKHIAVAIGQLVVGNVVLHNVEVTHMQCLIHHIVQVVGTALGLNGVGAGQQGEQIENDGQQQDAQDDVSGSR